MVQDLFGKLRRGLKKPPAYIAMRLLQEAVRVSDRWRAPRREGAMTEERLLAILEQPTIDVAWDALLERPYPFVPTSLSPDELEGAAPGEFERILAEADLALAHRIDLLGSGPVDLGPTIDWHTDYKTGRTWPPAYCHAIEYTNLGQPSDVKSVWELSRLQWLIPAAQAYVLTGEERYAAGVQAVLDQWIVANPYAGSVNWSCTMEAALRILTFSWFMQACGRSEAFADQCFRVRLLRSLVLHAEFTDRYIEKSDVNGNHYTADAAGLVFAGFFLGDGAAARNWLETGWRILADEISLQVFPDGVDFEASVPYHRLCAELFLLPALYGEAVGRQIPDSWRQRLVAMARFTAAYSRNDGGVPIWGDNDDARALPMAGKGLFDHRYLIALTALGLEVKDLLDHFNGSVAELVWLLGAPAARSAKRQERTPRGSQAFPQGGFYILAGAEDHVFVDCGPLGLAGRGGHGHNDLMSFEAALCGQRLIIDPGCYVYTASKEERNAFRSTACHNTPMVGDEEINRFIRPDYLWNLHNDAEAIVRRWEVDRSRSLLQMSHTGYERLAPPVKLSRTIELIHDRHRLIVDDIVDSPDKCISIPLHFAPGVEVAPLSDKRLLMRTREREFCLCWTGSADWAASLEATRIAPSYGVIEASHRVIWKARGAPEARLTVTIEPKPK